MTTDAPLPGATIGTRGCWLKYVSSCCSGVWPAGGAVWPAGGGACVPASGVAAGVGDAAGAADAAEIDSVGNSTTAPIAAATNASVAVRPAGLFNRRRRSRMARPGRVLIGYLAAR